MEIGDIVEAINRNQYRITDHADEEAAADRLSVDKVCESAAKGEIIEDYPTDRPHPSCLVFGLTDEGEPVHSVWAYNASIRWAVLITVYRPDPARWIDWKVRRRQ